MTKVVKFPDQGLAKFGLQQARKPRGKKKQDKVDQLNLFTGGKVVSLHKLSPFEEALMLDDRGDKAAAKSLYLKAIKEQDSLADAYCNLGILESLEGGVVKAIDCFTLGLKHDPRHYEAHYNLANVYAELGNYALAKVHYQIAIEIEPSFSNSYFNLGLTLALNKEYEDAIKLLGSYKKIASADDGQVDSLIQQLTFVISGTE